MANYTSTSSVMLNGEQAEEMLKKLTEKSKELREQWNKFREAGDTSGMKKVETQIKSVDKATEKLYKETLSVEKVLKNLSGTSLNELLTVQKKLNAEMSKMDRNSDEFKQAAKNAGILKNEIAQTKIAMGQWSSPMEKALGFAKGLLPAFGFAAILGGAKAAFNQVVNSTDTLSTQWAVFMGGMKGATEEFWRTLATGNWDNFFDNIRKAISLGREYEETLDKLDKDQRGLDIAEADSLNKILDLEIKLKNKRLTKAERIKAGEERLAIEKDLEKKRTEIAQQAFDQELKNTAQKAKLSEKELWDVMKYQDGETKFKAIELNKRIADYKEYYESLNSLQSIEDRAKIDDNAGLKLAKMREDLLKSEPVVLLYAKALRKEGFVTDEQLNKLVASYKALMVAQNSARLNIPKVETMINSLLAGEENETSGPKNGGDNTVAADALNLAHKQQLLALKQYYADKEHLASEYRARELALEIAHIQALSTIETNPEKQIDLKIKLNEAQQSYNAALKLAVPEMIKNEQQGDKLGARMLEIAKLTDYATQKQYEGITALDEMTQKQKTQMDTVQMMGNILTDYVTGAISGSIDSYESFGQTLILMSLQMLKQMVPIWAAQILGLSLASPESVATWGVAGMAKFTAITALMYAGIAAAEGAVNNNISKKKEKTKTYATGKYPDIEFAGKPVTGMYGSKPQLGIFNEVPGQQEMIIDGVTLRKIELNAPGIIESIYAVRDGRVPQYAEGKYPYSSLSEQASKFKFENKNEIEMIRALAAAVDKLSKNIDSQTKNPPKYYVAVEAIEKERNKYIQIEQTRGL